jgi:hypothetical protein
VSRATADGHLFATGSASVADLLRGELRPAVVLGAFPTAIYLGLVGGDVLAVLTRDAVRLPLGLTLSTRSVDDPLDRWVGPFRVGSSCVETLDRTVRLSRVVSVSAPTDVRPHSRAVAHATDRLSGLGVPEPLPRLLDVLAGRPHEAEAVVAQVLGLGPGLTPTGDDALAGFLVGAWSFGLVADRLRTAVVEAAQAGTTELSAALLRCASRGESIPQVNALVWALSERADFHRRVDDALGELGRVGHTSGTALAAGVVAAAQAASRARWTRA